MNEAPKYKPFGGGGPAGEGLQELRGKWWLFLLLGISLAVLGFGAVGAPMFVTLATVTLFGYLLLFGGVFELVGAFRAGKWSGFFLQLFGGVLRIVAGLLLVANPGLTAASFTLMLAVFLMFGGLFRIVVSVADRFPLWGWALINGVVTLILGILIWREWPESGLWVIGTFVGIDLLFSGLNWVMVGLTARQIPKVPTDT